jgi:hypothetical protein
METVDEHVVFVRHNAFPSRPKASEYIGLLVLPFLLHFLTI